MVEVIIKRSWCPIVCVSVNKKGFQKFFCFLLREGALTSDEESLNMSANASSLMLEPSFLACFKSFWKYF